MQLLAPTDSMFLLIERRNQPMHVGGLILIRPPKGEPDFLQGVIERARAATVAYPPFNKRLVKRMGLWFWEEDKDFDIEMHVHHVALPHPGRIRELLALVSKLHGALMDRAKPLWEMFLIEGVEDGRAALYFKLHHAMADGVAGARLMQKAFTEDPTLRNSTPIWARPPEKREAKAGQSPLDAAVDMARAQLNALPKVAAEVLRAIRDVQDDPDQVSVFQAPQTMFNQEISGSRRFAAQSWSLERIKAAAQKHGVTLNDLVLAMCSTALRRYLIEHDALPERPLIAMVPVSLRKDESDSGNQVALVLGNLATDIDDPGERLAAIARSMQNSKKRYADMTPLEIIDYVSTTMSLSGLNIATGLLPKVQAFNVIISNVPGPRKTLYYDGAKAEGVYPVSIVLDGQAVNITLESYDGKLEFGIIACSRTVPRVQRLLQYLEDGLVELERELENN
jgi:diacylglycerol O-acyltransferase